MKKRKPGPQKRRTGATTSEILARTFQADQDSLREVYAPHRAHHVATVIATRKTVAQRAWRALRLAYYRTWLALDRAWIRRCKADNCLTQEELEAAAARDTELTLIIMQIEAD